MNGVPIDENLNVDVIVQETEGYNGADMDYLCEKAKENAIRRSIWDASATRVITNEDFEQAYNVIKSSVLQSDREEMEKWVKENRS